MSTMFYFSAKKLLNTCFDKLESKKENRTHQLGKEVGLGLTFDVESATGFKIQDAVHVNK